MLKQCTECAREFECKTKRLLCLDCGTTNCKECGKDIQTNPGRKHKGLDAFCSQACQFAMNEYRIEGDVAYLKLTTNTREFVAEAMIDVADLDKAFSLGRRWCAAWAETQKQYRVVARSEGKMYKLHRYLMDAPDGLEVDHVNGILLDNRRVNLRLTTRGQNAQNLHSARNGKIRKSISGIRGVSWDGRTNKWHVRVGVNYKQIHIGYFDSIEEAECAAIKARRRHMTHSDI